MVFYYSSESPKIKKKKGHCEKKKKSYQKLTPDVNFILNSFSGGGKFLSGTFKKILSNCFVMINFDCEKLKANDLYVIFKEFIPIGCRILKIFILKKSTQNKKISAQYSSRVEKKTKSFPFVICDSLRTVSSLYKTCNGLQIGFTNNVVDIRPVLKISIKDFQIVDRMDEIPIGHFPSFLENSKNKHSHLSNPRFFSKKPVLNSTKMDSSPSLKVFKKTFPKKSSAIKNFLNFFSPKTNLDKSKFDFKVSTLNVQSKFLWKLRNLSKNISPTKDMKFFKAFHFFKNLPKYI
mmetsp:Transcript_62575/g.147157  ORF Transcript_62575/g.147157 Transcript_62575/m.147157 type:complete len:291 (-) Transcript_62575:21-893(-)